jgi:hypothetical protein
LGPPRGYVARTRGRLRSSVGGWQLSLALQGRLRRDEAVVQLTVDNSSVAGYSRDSKKVSAEMGRIFVVKIRYQETTSESKLRRLSM